METNSNDGDHAENEQGLVTLRECSNEDDKDRGTTYACSSSACFAVEKVVVQESTGEGEVAVMVEEMKQSVHVVKVVERDCRICHMSLDGSNLESGYPIELGCSCKDDLAVAHRHCAEAWFKIRGNKICEICGSNARNVVGVNNVEPMEQWSDANNVTYIRSNPAEAQHFWLGHRFLNFLLACTVFAFVISWLFHFNVPA